MTGPAERNTWSGARTAAGAGPDDTLATITHDFATVALRRCLPAVPRCRRSESYTEGLKRITRLGENDYRRFLLAECLQGCTDCMLCMMAEKDPLHDRPGAGRP